LQPSTELNNAKTHWRDVLPGEPMPENDQWCIWHSMHRLPAIISAITQTAVKRKKLGAEMTGDRVIRFASAIMTRLSKEATNAQAILPN
jgi:hypothetical protein